MGSPRVGLWPSTVHNSKAVDSSRAPVISLRAMGNRTSTSVAVEGVVGLTIVGAKVNPP